MCVCVFVCLIDLFVFFNSFVFGGVFVGVFFFVFLVFFFAMDTIISFIFFMILISNIILH